VIHRAARRSVACTCARRARLASSYATEMFISLVPEERGADHFGLGIDLPSMIPKPG